MMTTNLLVTANVKQLRTDGSFRILLPFFRTSWGVGALNSAIFNTFHNRVEFGTISEGLRNFGASLNPPTPTPPPPPPHPFGTPLDWSAGEQQTAGGDEALEAEVPPSCRGNTVTSHPIYLVV